MSGYSAAVARLFWEQDVGGSIPSIQTSYLQPETKLAGVCRHGKQCRKSPQRKMIVAQTGPLFLVDYCPGNWAEDTGDSLSLLFGVKVSSGMILVR